MQINMTKIHALYALRNFTHLYLCQRTNMEDTAQKSPTAELRVSTVPKLVLASHPLAASAGGSLA